jgi:hypothetical protein
MDDELLLLEDALDRKALQDAYAAAIKAQTDAFFYK